MISLVAAVVLACTDPWGSSDLCGGCGAANLVWKTPTADLRVKSPNEVKQQWPALSLLGPTDIVFTNATAKDGDKGSCATATATTKAQLTGSTPVPTPPPQPSPPTSPLPPSPVVGTCLTTGCAITWTAPTLNDDGSPIKPILKYLLSVNGVIQDVGPVLAYTLIKPAGDYTLSLQTVTADGTSGPTNSSVAHVVAVTPPPIPQPIIVKTPGKWVLMHGVSNVQKDLVSQADCETLLRAQPTGNYSCNLSDKYAVKQP